MKFDTYCKNILNEGKMNLNRKKMEKIAEDALDDIYAAVQKEMGIKYGDGASLYHERGGQEFESKIVDFIEDYAKFEILQQMDESIVTEKKLRKFEDLEKYIGDKEYEIDFYVKGQDGRDLDNVVQGEDDPFDFDPSALQIVGHYDDGGDTVVSVLADPLSDEAYEALKWFFDDYKLTKIEL